MNKRFRVNELVKYHYSDIGEYTDENHTDSPMRNDEVVELLNELHETNEQLQHDATILIQANQDYRKENEQLKIELEALRKKYNDFSDAVDKRLQEMDKRLLE